jgi:hypothetical protein
MDHVFAQAPSRPIELRHASTDRPNVIVVPERHFLAIEGTGHPGASGFRLATAALRAAHEAVRSRLRRDRFDAAPRTIFEIVWLTDPDWPLDKLVRVLADRDTVRWRQMLELPAAATADAIAAAMERSRQALDGVGPMPTLMTVTEGPAAQLLHVGPTADLSPTVARLHAFITEAGWRPRGRVHQLVFADPEAVPSARARSIIRMPIAVAEGEKAEPPARPA